VLNDDVLALPIANFDPTPAVALEQQRSNGKESNIKHPDHPYRMPLASRIKGQRLRGMDVEPNKARPKRIELELKLVLFTNHVRIIAVLSRVNKRVTKVDNKILVLDDGGWKQEIQQLSIINTIV
jgi:hypothetical protein